MNFICSIKALAPLQIPSVLRVFRRISSPGTAYAEGRPVQMSAYPFSKVKSEPDRLRPALHEAREILFFQARPHSWATELRTGP